MSGSETRSHDVSPQAAGGFWADGVSIGGGRGVALVRELSDDWGIAAARSFTDLERRWKIAAVVDLTFDPVEALVLDEDDRVVVADRGLEQALRVAGRRRVSTWPVSGSA